MQNRSQALKKTAFLVLLTVLVGYSTNCMAQAGNPFARPSAAPPPAAEKKVEAPPVPAMPPKLLEPDEDELKNTFSDLNLVATSGSQAVLKAGDVVYYLRSGDYFTYEGTRVRVKVAGNKVRLFTEKDGDEVYVAEVGNGVVASRTPTAPKKKAKENNDESSSKAPAAENKTASSSAAPAAAAPGVKK